jgi:integrase
VRFTCIAPGIYRENRTGRLYERPYVAGQRTWRRLAARTLKDAKAELSAKRTDQARSVHGFAKDPYGPPAHTVGQLCATFIEADCPDRNHRPRSGHALESEEYRIKTFLPFWTRKLSSHVKAKDCAEYYTWRKKRVKRGDGGRAIDMELTTLSNVFHWAVSVGKAESNPLANGRPRFRNTKAVRHCREVMPLDGNELHELAKRFFQDKRSEVLGWQLLFEAMTGCRTSEMLRLRWDAATRSSPGFIENDWLWIVRSKGGVKPFVTIHPALKDCIEAFKQWHAKRFSGSPWWFPSFRVKGEPITRDALTRALGKLAKDKEKKPKERKESRVWPKITSHGLRAFYVTVRRSMGISDAQIADELGDKTGAAIIASTYGAAPPNWRGSEALSWLPTGSVRAWKVLNLPENILVYPPVYRGERRSQVAHPSGVEPETF